MRFSGEEREREFVRVRVEEGGKGGKAEGGRGKGGEGRGVHRGRGTEEEREGERVGRRRGRGREGEGRRGPRRCFQGVVSKEFSARSCLQGSFPRQGVVSRVSFPRGGYQDVVSGFL